MISDWSNLGSHGRLGKPLPKMT